MMGGSRSLRARAFLALAAAVVVFLVLASMNAESPQLSNWRKAPLQAQIAPLPGDSLYERALVTLSNGRGLRAECGIQIPRSPGSHPGILILAGRETGKHAIEYVTDVRNIVVIALDYGFEPRESYTFWTFMQDIPAMRRAALDLVPSALMAMDYLRQRADVDTSRLILLGYSFGAPLVPAIAAHDREIAAAAMAYGGGDLRSLIAHNFRRSQSALTSEFVGALAWLLLRPIEPMRYAAKLAPMPLILVNGEQDELVPRRNTEMLYERALAPKRLVWLPSMHVNPENAELSHRVAIALRGEMLALGVLTPANVPPDIGPKPGPPGSPREKYEGGGVPLDAASKSGILRR